MHHRLSNLYLHGNALRKVLAQGVQVHCHAKRARVQSEGAANHRSGLPGTAGHRDLDIGPPGAHVTAAVAFHGGILHVNSAISDGMDMHVTFYYSKHTHKQKLSSEQRFRQDKGGQTSSGDISFEELVDRQARQF